MPVKGVNMVKSLLIFVFSFLLLQAVNAQKRDTSVYYLDNTGRVVSAKDSADFIVSSIKKCNKS